MHVLGLAGAMGLNLEDTDHATGALRGTEEQAVRLAAVREAAAARGVDLVLNARIDTLVHGDGGQDPLAELSRRGRAYGEAGASCVYPIFVAGEAEIAALVRKLGIPVNILLLPDGPDLVRLGSLGVARVSLGTGLERAASEFVARFLAELQGEQRAR